MPLPPSHSRRHVRGMHEGRTGGAPGRPHARHLRPGAGQHPGGAAAGRARGGFVGCASGWAGGAAGAARCCCGQAGAASAAGCYRPPPLPLLHGLLSSAAAAGLDGSNRQDTPLLRCTSSLFFMLTRAPVLAAINRCSGWPWGVPIRAGRHRQRGHRGRCIHAVRLVSGLVGWWVTRGASSLPPLLPALKGSLLCWQGPPCIRRRMCCKGTIRGARLPAASAQPPPSLPSLRSGIQHGVDMSRLLDASAFICDALGRPNGSRAAEALLQKRAAAAKAAAAAAAAAGGAGATAA